MIADKKRFSIGFIMMILFAIVLIVFFMPVFHGKNGLAYLDNLYNSISKGSAYYIPKVQEEAKAFSGHTIGVMIGMKDEKQTRQTAILLKAAFAETSNTGAQLRIKGDLGLIIANCLDDSDIMYHNQGNRITEKYGYDEKQVLFNWWTALKEMDKDLKKQKLFKEADFILHVNKKAVEMAYNYYQIEAQKISDRMEVVTFSLIFYVIYTVWYGFAFLFMFEGWGMRLEH
ncbi:MAG: hypothetical protein JW932_14305 [Deltaproteobacteria bacterium]|nr:hypothetical protein [Deltaproteobacteria bacterium]